VESASLSPVKGPKETHTGREKNMEKDGVTFPLVLSILGAGCIITLLSGDFAIWIPIILAFVVVGELASKYRL
jgi:hypothetical protein